MFFLKYSMFFLIKIFEFFKLSIQQPEICLQPHIFKVRSFLVNLEKPYDDGILLDNIEFIIDFKDQTIYDCYSSFIKELGMIDLISYNIINDNTHLKLINEIKDENFKFLSEYNLFIIPFLGHPFQMVFSLMRLNNSSEDNFYYYISETKNKAWKFIINLYNYNSKSLYQLETLIFKLNDEKTEIEIFKDGLFTNQSS